VQRCLATGRGDGANAAFQRRHPLLEHLIGGVADAAVHMACAFQVEQGCRLVTGFKDKRGGQVDRNGPCTRAWVGPGACMQRQRVEMGVGIARHVILGNENHLEGYIVGYIDA